RRRRRRGLQFLGVSIVVLLIGGVLAGFMFGTTFRDLVILDRDLVARVDTESAGTADLTEGDYVLVAVGHNMTSGRDDDRVAYPRTRLTDPNGVELRIRPPGYTSRTSTGEERIVVGDFTVDTAGTHQVEVGASPTPGLESLAIAPKESVSATRVVLGVIGAGFFVLGLLG